MKIEGRQVYFNAVLGGLGGLLGWAAVMKLGDVVSLQEMNLYLRDAIMGLVLGICIGFAIGGTDGLVVTRSMRRFLWGACVGAGLGAVGGLIGLPLGEWIFNLAGGGIWPRSIGWALFGMFVGASDGFAQMMPSKIRYGIFGGLLGGLIGGSTYEALVPILGLAWGSAIGLILLGACIGALVGLVESLLRTAWLWFAMGRLEGQTRTLDSRKTMTLGRSPRCSIILPEDDTIAPFHAEIAFQGKDFLVRPREGSVIVSRGGKEEQINLPYVLQPGDRIFLGKSRMVFRTEETKKPGGA